MEWEVEAVFDVFEVRLHFIRIRSGEEGEVLLMQMCQWIMLSEPFLPGSAADMLLESLVEVTNTLAYHVEQSQHQRKGQPRIQIEILFLSNMTLDPCLLHNCFCSTSRALVHRGVGCHYSLCHYYDITKLYLEHYI